MNRKDNRLKNYDYSQNGAYFITICVKDMKCVLSQINEPKASSTFVGADIGGMKRYVSKQIGFSIWQKGFYDHIIRDDYDYQTRYQYIDENPKK